MTTASTSLSRAQSTRPLIAKVGAVWMAVIAALFCLVHWEIIRRTYLIASTNSNWSHAFIVPFISLYYIYQKRDRLSSLDHRVFPPGLLILIAGLFCYAFAIYPVRNDMIRGYSMILTLVGLVLFLLGPRMMQVLWFPIVYLMLAIKVSDQIWDRLAWKLQIFAAGGATLALKFIAVFMDFGVNDRGTTIDLTFMHHGHWVANPLNVAEACSGLRMLMAFVALGVALAFLWDRRWWQRLIMVVSTIPIAIGVNIARVTVVGVLFTYNQDMATGSFHKLIGMLMLIPAAGAFLLLGWVLDRVMIEEPRAGGSAGERGHAEIERVPLSRSFRLLDLIRGLVLGGLLGFFSGASYILMVLVLRPDVARGFPVPLRWALLVLGVLGLFGISGGYRWLLPRGASALLASRRLNTSLGAVAALLLVAFVGQSSVLGVTHMVLFKKTLPLRAQLITVPKAFGHWRQVGADQILKPSVVETLGTDLYLTRYYVDTTVDQPRMTFDKIMKGDFKAGSVVRLHVAYYTGTPDTVPHVPDRCFVAGGVKPMGTSTAYLTLSGPQYKADGDQLVASSPLLKQAFGDSKVRIPSRSIEATDFAFAPGGGSSQLSNVIYFFAANGKFLSGPKEVRLLGFSPWDKYGYYCKVEVLLPGVGKKPVAVKRVSQFLSAALPEVMACLPDWYDVKHGKYPPLHADNDGSGGF